MTTLGTATVPLLSDLDSEVSIYLDIFQKHRSDVYLHLRGEVNDNLPNLPSYLPPASYWTAKEKDLFFHGLSIFSRLRPDLIAMHIKTKSTVEVCLYLHCLETAAAYHGSSVPDEPQRNVTPPALQVSDKWVSHEEYLADKLLGLESCSWSADKDLVLPSSDCHCPSITVSPVDSYSPSPANAYLNHMDSVCLITQESIIRQQMAEDQDRRIQMRMTGVDGKEEASVSTHIDEENHFEEGCSLGKDYNPADSDKGRQSADESEDALSDEKLLERRLKKRLYMRRKRAEKSGRPVVPASIRLRPGRKPKARKPTKPRSKMYKTKNRPVLDSNDEDMDDIYEGRSQGGTTRPYRIRKIFQEHGVDAQLLSHMGIGLFNLLALSKLLSNLNKSESPSDAVFISAQSIHLFSTITKEFVSEMVRRSIVSKEQEIRMKRTMPVWKYETKEITVENVAECLYSMGLGHLGKDRSSKAVSDNVEGRLAPVALVNGGITPLYEETSQQYLPPKLTKDQLFRTLRHSIPESMLWCSLPSHRDLITKDDILPDEMDLEMLNEELRDEEEFDIYDDKLSANYETSLWSTQCH